MIRELSVAPGSQNGAYLGTHFRSAGNIAAGVDRAVSIVEGLAHARKGPDAQCPSRRASRLASASIFTSTRP